MTYPKRLGTVKFNLDPFGKHTDAELEEVLAAVQLHGLAGGGGGGGSDDPGGGAPEGLLQVVVAEAGANLSIGQRQLLSLARAMLKRARLIVMDEATANVDFETDKVIQSLLRGHELFKRATLVVVARKCNSAVVFLPPSHPACA